MKHEFMMQNTLVLGFETHFRCHYNEHVNLNNSAHRESFYVKD